MSSARKHKVPRSCLVYTPSLLADAMVEALKISTDDKVLEPCVGEGALLRALHDAGVSRNQITGLDLRPKKTALDCYAKVRRRVDFLHWSRSTRPRFDKIVANPPYVPIERLHSSVRNSACGVKAFADISVSASANTWYAFLIAAIGLLRTNGSLCFVLPAAWDFANYAKPLRENIGRFFERVEIHRSKSPLFHAVGIQDGSIILVAEKFRGEDSPSKQSNSMRVEHAAIEDLIVALRQREKFKFEQVGDRGANETTSCPAVCRPIKTAKLKDLASISIGAVTGDASYFLLNETRRLEYGLPTSSLRPVVSKAKHVTSYSIDKDYWSRLRREDERVWLFDPSPAAMKHPAVSKYIRWGENSGCNLTNTKIAQRDPWYRPRLPALPDAYLSGMSSVGPFICFREMERLTATNTLYVVSFMKGLTQDQQAAISLALLTSEVSSNVARLGRTYSAGLLKYEPGDLKDIVIPLAKRSSGAASAYRAAVNLLVSGEISLSRQKADDWFARNLI